MEIVHSPLLAYAFLLAGDERPSINTELLVMGFKHEKLQYKIQKFQVSQQDIMPLWWPVIITFHMTDMTMQHPNCTLLITSLQHSETLSTHILEIRTIQIYIKGSIHFTLINKQFIVATTQLWTLLTL
jgi:hypothetical protein